MTFLEAVKQVAEGTSPKDALDELFGARQKYHTWRTDKNIHKAEKAGHRVAQHQLSGNPARAAKARGDVQHYATKANKHLNKAKANFHRREGNRILGQPRH